MIGKGKPVRGNSSGTGTRVAGAAPQLGERQALAQAIRRAQGYLLARQDREGYWVGELEADASVTAGYVPLMYFMLGRVDPERQRKAVCYVLSKQRPDGSWSSYHGGPGDLSVSIQAYFSLKLSGIPATEPAMQRARDFILSQGGIGRANVITRIWLAVFGQYDWRGVPTVPPEVIFLPPWFYLSIYDFASWSRATIVALSVVLTQRPVCVVPESAGLDELYACRAVGAASCRVRAHRGSMPTAVIARSASCDEAIPNPRPGDCFAPLAMTRRKFPNSWEGLFLVLDRLLKLWQHLPYKPGRRLALARAAAWIEEHQEADGSWGGIMLPWVYSLIALKSLGYPLDHPVISRGLKGLAGFIAEDEETMRLQPATSPVWDTAWAAIALAESGLAPDHPALRQAAGWLMDQEIRVGGDWEVKTPIAAAGAWAFEFENDLYPDLDDTAVVARALRRVRLPLGGEGAKAKAIGRALRWVQGMQSRDGGWAAFDRDCDKEILAHVPFADFMSPLDPTCADVTAHVIEFLAEAGPDGPALERALSFLEATQEPDGSWYGRWGVNYLYGTGLALAALAAAGPAGDCRRGEWAASWLRSRQNPDGGWGETCASYERSGPRGRGPSTASQTAWALTGLIAAGEAASPAVRRGIAYLLATQEGDGSWPEAAYTGTGFPRAFYLRYDLYRVYFPLLALARYHAYLERTLT